MSTSTSMPSEPPPDSPVPPDTIVNDPHTLARANLDYLLREMRAWAATNRIPPQMLGPLVRDYATRRALLDQAAPPPMSLPADSAASVINPGNTVNPWATQLDLSPSQPVAPPPPLPRFVPPYQNPAYQNPAAPSRPIPPPPPSPITAVAAFLEERNIATLHIVGSLLLLTGLIVLLQWQWSAGNRGFFLLILAALTGGLLWGGQHTAKDNRTSGLILSGLGALILPLNVIAARIFGFLGGEVLNWDMSALLTSGISLIAYGLIFRRTRHPFFAGLTAIAGGLSAIFLPRAFFGPSIWALLPTCLPTAYAYFRISDRLQKRGENKLALPFVLSGHGLVAATAALSLLGASPEGRLVQQGMVALVCAGIYADIAIRLRLPLFSYVAASALVVAGQLFVPEYMGFTERGMVAVACALLLQVVGGVFSRLPILNSNIANAANPSSGDTREEDLATQQAVRQSATVYQRVALLLVYATLPPFTFVITAHLLDLTLAALPTTAAQGLFVGGVCGLLLTHQSIADTTRREYIYPAFAAAFTTLATFCALLAHTVPVLSGLAAPSVVGMLFAALCAFAAQLPVLRPNSLITETCEGVARLIGGVSALLPWAYLWMQNSEGVRLPHLLIALPGVALLGAYHVWYYRTDSSEVRRDHALQLMTLALGSLSFFAGASTPHWPYELRAMWASVGGAAMALMLSALSHRLPLVRRTLAAYSCVLTTVALVPLALTTSYQWESAGVSLLLCGAWAFAATARREANLLYGTGLMIVLSACIACLPIDNLFVAHFGGPHNPTRWLLPLLPLLAGAGYALRARQSLGTPDYARPLLHCSLVASVLGGLGQTYLLVTGNAPGATNGLAMLWLLSVSFAVFALARRRSLFLQVALLPLVAGYAPYLWRHHLANEAWLVSPWWAASVLAVVGACGLLLEQRGDTVGRERTAAAIGARCLVAATLQVVGVLLPGGWHYSWAICLLPTLALLYIWRQGVVREAVREIATISFALLLVDLLRYGWIGVSLPTAQLCLLLTTLLYGGLGFWHGLRNDSVVWLQTGVTALTLGGMMGVSGYPGMPINPSLIGFALSVAALIWWSMASLLRTQTLVSSHLAHAAVVCAVAGSVGAVIGQVSGHQHEAWGILALTVASIVFGLMAAQRQGTDKSRQHLSFASGFLAYCFLLNNGLPFALSAIDLYLLPLGAYIILLGVLAYRRAGSNDPNLMLPDREAALLTCMTGLIVLIGPSLLAVWGDAGTFWHPFLLVAECLTTIAVGMAQRIRRFIAVGMGFLVALLGIKAVQPGQGLQFGIYLLLLGVLVLVVGVFFDRQRTRKRGQPGEATDTVV